MNKYILFFCNEVLFEVNLRYNLKERRRKYKNKPHGNHVITRESRSLDEYITLPFYHQICILSFTYNAMIQSNTCNYKCFCCYITYSEICLTCSIIFFADELQTIQSWSYPTHTTALEILMKTYNVRISNRMATYFHAPNLNKIFHGICHELYVI